MATLITPPSSRSAATARVVFALVCLTDYNPRDPEGFIFGYKDMTEHMGSCESDYPEDILDLLTPTDRPYAIVWRAHCRKNAATRRSKSSQKSASSS